MENKNSLQHSRVYTGKRYIYSVCEDGTVVKFSQKKFTETNVRVYLKSGIATVSINGKNCSLKKLVAENFIKILQDDDCVEVIDKNPFNCSVENLRIINRRKLGQKYGHLSKSKKITVDGVAYKSVKAAAKELFVSSQTIFDYLNGKVKNSILEGVHIEILED